MLDAVGGIGCSPLGHNHPRWVARITAQAKVLVAAANSYLTEPQQALAGQLAERCPISDARIFLANTGTEATEAALKLALKASGRNTILAFEGAFHGRSMGALSLTANPAYREPYIGCPADEAPERFAQMNVLRVPYGDLEAVREVMAEHGSSMAAIMLEPIQGESGVFPATKEFLLGVRELCTRHGALLGVDEIQSGSGRTGYFTAWQAIVGDAAEPDILWLAKALGAGFPVAACITRNELAEKMGLGSHGTTYGGNPLACAAALETLAIFDDEDLLAKAGRQIETLRTIAKAEPIAEVTEIRGLGAMIGIQLGERSERRAKDMGEALRERGVLVTVPGGHTVRLLLPYAADEPELRQIWAALASAVAGTAPTRATD